MAALFLFASCKQSNEELLDKAYYLSNEKKYDEAIKIYTKVIERNDRLQLAYYNRGFAYMAMKEYEKALADFNRVMALQTVGGFTVSYNPNMPFAGEEVKAGVPYMDALYQAAQVKFHMDSSQSSFKDFQTLVENNYEQKSNCILWQGTILYSIRKQEKACEYFQRAKAIAVNDDEKNEADLMISTYCNETNYRK